MTIVPIEVRELVIKATVESGGGKGPADAATPAGQPPSEDLVAECVEQVLDALRRRQER